MARCLNGVEPGLTHCTSICDQFAVLPLRRYYWPGSVTSEPAMCGAHDLARVKNMSPGSRSVSKVLLLFKPNAINLQW
jgi:hypothetical protein